MSKSHHCNPLLMCFIRAQCPLESFIWSPSPTHLVFMSHLIFLKLCVPPVLNVCWGQVVLNGWHCADGDLPFDLHGQAQDIPRQLLSGSLHSMRWIKKCFPLSIAVPTIKQAAWKNSNWQHEGQLRGKEGNYCALVNGSGNNLPPNRGLCKHCGGF